MTPAQATEEARTLKAARRFDEAKKVLEAALAESPEHPGLSMSLADLFVRTQRFGEAEGLAEALLATRPSDPFALTVKGNVAAAESRFEDARQYFESALSRAAPRAAAYLRGRLYGVCLSLGRHTDADRLCHEALRAVANEPTWLARLAHVRRKQGDVAGARELFRKALDVDPGQRRAFAELLGMEGTRHTREAFESELNAILKYAGPDLPEVRLLRARVLEDAGRTSEARDEVTRAVEQDPENDYVRRTAGFFFHRAGDDVRAFELLRPLFVRNPGDVYVRSVVRKIGERPDERSLWIDTLTLALASHPRFKPLYGLLAHARKLADRAAASPGPPPKAAAPRATQPLLPLRHPRSRPAKAGKR